MQHQTATSPGLRKSGLAIIGDVPWGSHFCQFYQNQQDLVDVLVPYFQQGLTNNEACMWVTSQPLRTDQARIALQNRMEGIDRYLASGQLEILDYTEWYTRGGRFVADNVLQGWAEKEDLALRRGFDGLRLTGNTFWLEKKDWQSFYDYEAAIDSVIGKHRMMALCTYSLDRCDASEVIDVVSNHEFALIKRGGKWEVIESQQRRRAVEELREKSRQFRTLFNGMSEGCALHEIICDPAGRPCDYRFLDANPAFERLTGLKRDEILGRTVRTVLPGIESHWIDTYGQVALTGRPCHFESQTGTLGRSYDVFAFSPSESQFITLFLDVTDRKKAEQALRQAKEEAEAANAAKDRFLAILSHELRTPLTPVVMAVSALDGDPRLPEDVREDLSLVRHSVELEVRLIDDLLDLNRIARGKLELRLRLLDAHQKLHNVLELCLSELRQKGVSITTHLYAHSAQVQGDAGRLQQVFLNLIRNATKFTPAGGRIAVRSSNPSPDRIRFQVADTGVGIDPIHLPRLFNAFEQGDRFITREYGGLGLGLAISKALVEMHGGSIWAESPGKGQGATFFVELPLSSSAGAPSSAPVEPAGTGNISCLRVLLVEDHEPTAQVISRLLSKHGHTVRRAASVRNAVEVGSAERFDLLVSDMGLPDGSGLEVLRALRATHPGLVGIALSGYGMEEDVRKSGEAGFAEHLVKPVDVATLVAAIDRVVQSEQHP